jgi:methylated-DNA-[protein]-cysteine S-methyltransferase
MSFSDKVISVVKKIKPGETLSYQEVATMAGNPKAVRAVGNLMAKNYDSDIPCHRVIKSDGTPGHYNRGGSKGKLALLRSEGVII